MDLSLRRIHVLEIILDLVDSFPFFIFLRVVQRLQILKKIEIKWKNPKIQKLSVDLKQE